MPKVSFASYSIRELLLVITVTALAIPYLVHAFQSRDEPLYYLDLDPGYFAEWAKEIDPSARLVERDYGGGNSMYGKNYFAFAEVAADERLHKRIADHWRMRIRQQFTDKGWTITHEVSWPQAWQVTIAQDHSLYQMYFYVFPNENDYLPPQSTLRVCWIELAYTDRRSGLDLYSQKVSFGRD